MNFAEIIAQVKADLGDNWFSNIYKNQVRTLRTRRIAVEIAARVNQTDIQHTLLGVELKVGKQRISCPDLATARYLQVFVRIGVSEVAIPYDITKISKLADDLESSWQRALLLVLQNETDAENSRFRGQLSKIVRQEIQEIGAGELLPEFNKTTRQGLK
ncbi:MAG: hypothetical protein H7Z37_14500 [Pyrinomonadaceae bacterium]|nr:hypothetical protein [Pyrinomonadaceae bacterium]